jgi:hypothetical protein
LIETPVYSLHGLRVRSAVTLDAPLDDDAGHDIEVAWGDARPVGQQPQAGEEIAAVWVDDRHLSRFVVDDEGYLLRYHGLCDVRVDRSLTSVVAHPHPGADEALISILIGGSVVAFLLTMSGHCTLHASAVQVDGNALAFVGASGSGKSTLAAICCAAGAELLSDDAIRLAISDGGIYCFRGTASLRLRPQASDLAQLVPASATRGSPDGRTVVRPDALSGRSASICPLAGVVLPQPAHDATEVGLVRLGSATALSQLLGHLRTAGLRHPGALRSQFQGCAAVARSTPVIAGTIPWAPPWSSRLLDELARSVGLRPPGQLRWIGP